MSSNFIMNFFGTGIRYWICEIPNAVFEEMNDKRIKHKVEWEQLLFDFDFLKHFGYNHWCELSKQPEKIGFQLSTQNRIEIKSGAKFISRFKSIELQDEETLFPLFNTVKNEIKTVYKENSQTILLLEYQKGLIAKFKFETDDFSINQLEFQLSTIENETWLTEIVFNSNPLHLFQDDTVSIGTRVILKD